MRAASRFLILLGLASQPGRGARAARANDAWQNAKAVLHGVEEH